MHSPCCVGALRAEEFLRQAKREGKALLTGIFCRIDILQPAEAGETRRTDDLEKLFDILAAQRVGLFFDPTVLAEEMQCAQQRAVALYRSDGGYF